MLSTKQSTNSWEMINTQKDNNENEQKTDNNNDVEIESKVNGNDDMDNPDDNDDNIDDTNDSIADEINDDNEDVNNNEAKVDDNSEIVNETIEVIVGKILQNIVNKVINDVEDETELPNGNDVDKPNLKIDTGVSNDITPKNAEETGKKKVDNDIIPDEVEDKLDDNNNDNNDDEFKDENYDELNDDDDDDKNNEDVDENADVPPNNIEPTSQDIAKNAIDFIIGKTFEKLADKQKRRGNQAYSKQEYIKALRFYKVAHELNPYSPVYLVNQAVTYYVLDKLQECRRMSLESIRFEKKYDSQAQW